MQEILKPEDAETIPNVRPSGARIRGTGTSYIYFAQCGGTGPIKIGRAIDVEKRIAALQVGCPYEIRLLLFVEGGESRESSFHCDLHEHRIRGEWFRAGEVRLLMARLGLRKEAKALRAKIKRESVDMTGLIVGELLSTAGKGY